MAAGGRLQSARYEFKYLVDERTAEEIRHFVRSYLEPDAYTRGREGTGYPVHSLYLDSKDLMLCRATMEGIKNRFKLRIRFYESGTGPVYFEIKRRVNDVILKQRAAVKASSVPRLIAGKPPQRADLTCCDEKNSFALYNFCYLRDGLGAIPAAYTSYVREGYEAQGSNVCRVTFDRSLRAGEYSGRLGVSTLERWARPQVMGTVLELKFTDTFPNWMQIMVEAFNLTRTSMPKYVKCVSLLRSTQQGSPVMSAFERPAVVGIPEDTDTLLRCA